MIKLPPKEKGLVESNPRKNLFLLWKLTSKIAWTPAQKAIAHYFEPDWYYQNEHKYGLPIIKAADIEPSFGQYAEYYCRNRDDFVAYSLRVLRGFAIEASKGLSKADKAFLKHCYKTGDYGEQWLQIIDRLIKPFLVANRRGGYVGYVLPPKGTKQWALYLYVEAYFFAAARFRFDDALEYKLECGYFGVFFSDSILSGGKHVRIS